MKKASLSLIILARLLTAGSWAAGLGGGIMGVPVISQESDSIQTPNRFRIQAEGGYYGDFPIDVLAEYSENYAFPSDQNVVVRDQHMSLLAEYRLLAIGDTGALQAAVGAGPSLHRISYYSAGTGNSYAPAFTLDAEASLIYFISRCFFLRAQACYTFLPSQPESGFLALTITANLRAVSSRSFSVW